MRRFLAFDLGAESGRTVLGELHAGVLTAREMARFSNSPIRLHGSMRWNVDAILRGVGAGLAAAGDGPLESVGVDAWGCDYALLDPQGAIVEPPYHYRDHRTDGVMACVLDRLGADRVYGTTGIQCLPFNTLYQLVAAHTSSPDTLQRAERLLTMPDLVNYRLTGRMTCEYTNATTTQCVEARTQAWAFDLLEELELPARLFGEIVRPGSVLGPLTSAVVPHLDGTPVVAPACHDTGSAFAAVDAGGRTALLSCGTWSLLGTEVAAPVITGDSRTLNFTNEGGVNGTWRLLKNISGLWLLQACRQSWARDGAGWTYDQLVQAAGEADADAFRTVIDPDDPSFLNPDDMVAAIDRYAVSTGQPTPRSPGGYTRAILESLALKYRVVLDGLEQLTARRFDTLRIVGGGSRNRLLSQFTADATGRTVLAGPVEATALGNLAVQMVATGAVASLAEARAVVERSFPAESFAPQSSRAWEDALQRLRERLQA